MFGLSTKEMLAKLIKTACIDNAPIYKRGVEEFVKNFDESLPENELQKRANAIRRDYLFAVFDELNEKITQAGANVSARSRIALTMPSVTGLPPEMTVDYFSEYGISAGAAFGILYFALTGKSVDTPKLSKICINLTHFQNEVMAMVSK